MRKLLSEHDHPVKFIADKATACERHLTTPSMVKLFIKTDARTYGPNTAWDAILFRTLWAACFPVTDVVLEGK